MRAGVVLGLVASLALSGCSSSAAQAPPRALPTPSASATPAAPPVPSATATPIPTPTTLATVPAAAQPATPQGAAAFVKFFFQQVDRAFKLADSTVLLRWSASNCKTCANFAGAAVRLQKDETHLAEDAILVRSAEAAPVEAGDPLWTSTRTSRSRGKLMDEGTWCEHLSRNRDTTSQWSCRTSTAVGSPVPSLMPHEPSSQRLTLADRLRRPLPPFLDNTGTSGGQTDLPRHHVRV